MSKKSYIQLFLISVFIFISLFLFKYFKKTGFDNNINANLEQNTNSGESLIEDLKYQSVDKKGNKYRLKQKKEI